MSQQLATPTQPAAGGYSAQGQTTLERQASRLSNTLARIQSTEAYPPPDEQRNGDDDGAEEEDEEKKKTGEGLALQQIDIEHVPVDDDPRDWSNRKKWTVLLIMTFALLGPIMASSIYNPVINEVRETLNASEAEIGLSISLYILFQGFTPVLWAAISEVNGRKMSYLISYAIYVVALVVASRANSMPLLIAMRALQATGSGAVTSAGAGSLADMYEVHERGEKLGIYYGVPMFGPSVAPIFGGALGRAFGWRSVFYFLAVYAFIMECFFVFFPDSWRRERSRLYQMAVRRATKRAEHQGQKKLQRKAKLAQKSQVLDTIAASPPHTPGPNTPVVSRRGSEVDGVDGQTMVDVRLGGAEEQKEVGEVTVTKRRWLPFGRKGKTVVAKDQETVKLSFRDLNPLPPMVGILKRPTNLIILMASALMFSAQYTIVYTASITLGDAPYNYNSLNIGLVVLAFGVGNITGSIVGGRYSDTMLRRLKKANGGVGVPEMRLKSTVIAMPVMIASFLAYAWCAQERVHIAGIVITLFFAGIGILWAYSSTLAYVVDANPGASASAVSCNSLFRGICACVMSQIAVPIRNSIGDGGLYTLFAGILAISCAGILLLIRKGEEWRAMDFKWPWERKKKSLENEKVAST
ncbi:hypothetical protein IAT38_003858 [Cryptococcus sp. DSM 104549]